MKRLIFSLVPALMVVLAHATLAEEGTVSFPAECNGGGGMWSRPVTVKKNICERRGNDVISIYEGGHCNGHRESAIKCRDGEIVGFEILDCYCD